MKPGNTYWLSPCDSPFQCDVISFIHYTVLKGLSEKGWIQILVWLCLLLTSLTEESRMRLVLYIYYTTVKYGFWISNHSRRQQSAVFMNESLNYSLSWFLPTHSFFEEWNDSMNKSLNCLLNQTVQNTDSSSSSFIIYYLHKEKFVKFTKLQDKKK